MNTKKKLYRRAKPKILLFLYNLEPRLIFLCIIIFLKCNKIVKTVCQFYLLSFLLIKFWFSSKLAEIKFKQFLLQGGSPHPLVNFARCWHHQNSSLRSVLTPPELVSSLGADTPRTRLFVRKKNYVRPW